MPRRSKRSYKNKRKRRYKNTASFTGKMSLYQQPNSIIQRRAFCKHKYAGSGTLNVVAGSLSLNTYRANSMFDPQVAAGGHQPMLFDQMGSWYNKFTVIGSKITVRFNTLADDADTSDGLTVNLSVRSGTASTSDENYREQGPTKTSYIKSGGGSTGVKTLTMTHSPKKWFGLTNIMDNDSFQGTTSADCAEQSVFHVYATTPGQVSTADVAYTFEIEYSAVWTDPRTISPS